MTIDIGRTNQLVDRPTMIRQLLILIVRPIQRRSEARITQKPIFQRAKNIFDQAAFYEQSDDFILLTE